MTDIPSISEMMHLWQTIASESPYTINPDKHDSIIEALRFWQEPICPAWSSRCYVWTVCIQLNPKNTPISLPFAWCTAAEHYYIARALLLKNIATIEPRLSLFYKTTWFLQSSMNIALFRDDESLRSIKKAAYFNSIDALAPHFSFLINNSHTLEMPLFLENSTTHPAVITVDQVDQPLVNKLLWRLRDRYLGIGRKDSFSTLNQMFIESSNSIQNLELMVQSIIQTWSKLIQKQVTTLDQKNKMDAQITCGFSTTKTELENAIEIKDTSNGLKSFNELEQIDNSCMKIKIK